MNTKKWYQSQTIWLAVAQGVVGISVALLSTNQIGEYAGIVVMIKSFADFYLRMHTTTPIV